ncbi:MAG: hypothetical protein M0P91_12165 [Sulfuricurvum sp.]|jgi:hypothetical protein|uniref:hypothetical protein n=1 Tax=Sulfuricurvum sp. TaxID=2025608 RepID=UPI0026004B17|nr:hypothetical protein [Sulfuricurvum sp.]MCK9373940.1 hypothetical protein [Sulfuricurvum sp.]
MEFIEYDAKRVSTLLRNLYGESLQNFFNFILELLEFEERFSLPDTLVSSQASPNLQMKFMEKKLNDNAFRKKIVSILSSTSETVELYRNLVWEYEALSAAKLPQSLLKPQVPDKSYGTHKVQLPSPFSLITHSTQFGYTGAVSHLMIDDTLAELLKYFLPLPDHYVLIPAQEIAKTEYTYSNESGILGFMSVFDEMIQHRLVDVSDTNEKPSAKTLNVLRQSGGIDEFFTEKGMDLYANDMLTRSFYHFIYIQKGFKNRELESLKTFVNLQLNNRISFFISRIFTSHLKKVRFSYHDTSERSLFLLVKELIEQMPKEGWVSFENIDSFCTYRKVEFHLESSYKTDSYTLECDPVDLFGFGDKTMVDCEDFYDELFFQPVLKAMFFYLGALGLLELKYDDPLSACAIQAKGKRYISAWDGLKYIRLSDLGRYVFGFAQIYTPIVVKKEIKELKLDEYKPIITLHPDDSVTIAKLDAYAEKIDDTRYALSYSKIFKECSTYKSLEIKIDTFYNQIASNPPKVFQDFFDEIKKRACLLKKEPKQIVIHLENNHELLALFMNHKKLQEYCIKGQGYRILVEKENLPKVKKIVQENGFFIDF